MGNERESRVHVKNADLAIQQAKTDQPHGAINQPS
jgi:hypothetical protein